MSDIELDIRAIVRDEIARVLGTTTPVYSTASRETWPPRCRTRRMARDRIRAVVGHERLGDGRETQWQVARDAYDRHHTRRAALHVVPPTPTDEEIAARAIDAAGLRATRRTS